MEITAKIKPNLSFNNNVVFYDPEDEESIADYQAFQARFPLNETQISHLFGQQDAPLSLSRQNFLKEDVIEGSFSVSKYTDPTIFLKIGERKKYEASIKSFRWKFRVTLTGKEGKDLVQKITDDKKYLRWLSYKRDKNRGVFLTFEKETYIYERKGETGTAKITAGLHPNVGSYICTAGNPGAELLGRDNTIELLSKKTNYDSPLSKPETYANAKTVGITVRPIGTRLKPLVIEPDTALFRQLLTPSYCADLWDRNVMSNMQRRSIPANPCFDCAISCPHSRKSKATIWARLRRRQTQTRWKVRLNWPTLVRRYLIDVLGQGAGLPDNYPHHTRERRLLAKNAGGEKTFLDLAFPDTHIPVAEAKIDELLNQRFYNIEQWNLTPEDPEILHKYNAKIQKENEDRAAL